MRRAWALLVLTALPAAAQVTRGHRLPPGEEHPVREREIDIQEVRADLKFDMDQETIAGVVAIRFTPLRAGLSGFSLDQADLSIDKVELVEGSAPLAFETRDRKLRIELPQAMSPGQSAAVAIHYSCHPKTGMYFFPRSSQRAAQAWNYGEGGLHYGWLPLFNDTNDRFTAAFNVTVARPFSVLANGVLQGIEENPDRTRTYHWLQAEPIPNYLLTVDVGELAEVPIGTANLQQRQIPLSAWTSPGTEDAAAHAFKDTPAMVEFFSQRFGYPYPWDKYDQVALREFAIGAMETTTVTGFSESHLHRPEDPPDSSPDLEKASPTWTYTDTIAHELAHHWFGDLVTCRSLASIWLNESFATFCHTLWNEHSNGADDLTYQRWRYLGSYLDYVRREGQVRPMEFFRYSSPHAIYQEETTYLKGSLVLHMLRHFLGDADFFRAISDYLHQHEFGNVESVDLQRAFEQAVGKDLSWFFDDWIRGGGGHPSFEVSYRWAPERQQIDLTVNQIHSDLPFENDFRLPVDIEIVSAAGARLHTIEVSGWSTHVALPCDSKPLAVIFDKGGWLIDELKFDRPLEEVLYQLAHDDLAGRLRAARSLAESFPRRSETAAALSQVLTDPQAHWGLRQEAALDLGSIGGESAAQTLARAAGDSDRRIRRAVAVALGRLGGSWSTRLLRQLIQFDGAEDVVGAAELSLGKLHAPGARDLLTQQLGRESRWWDCIRVGALQGLSQLQDASLAPTFHQYVGEQYDHDVRGAALEGWFGAAPEDPLLAARLRELAHDRNRHLRELALEQLKKLHRADDLEFLKQFAAAETDLDLAQAASEAVEETEYFVKP
jgi:aminopeptidase N